MVPAPIANSILNSATIQLQKSNQFFLGKNLTLGKFGEELLKHQNSTSSQQQLSTTINTGSRPITFIPGGSEGAVQSCAKNTTSKRSKKGKRLGGTGTNSLPTVSAKR